MSQTKHKPGEAALFEEAMAGTRPLTGTDKLPLPKPKRATPGQVYRREAAERMLDDETFLPTTFIDPVPADAVLGYKRPGVQHGVFRKLRRGEYPLEALLDLHHLTVAKARRQVYGFVQACLRDEVRCALIIHGKGGRGAEGERRAMLKSCLAYWLPMLPEVMAFHSAQKCHGGHGALYVMLKKGALQKERNRRRFQMAER
ncbi:MAG: DNA endonuclease SmrA [Methylohalobius sp. ZOD2]